MAYEAIAASQGYYEDHIAGLLVLGILEAVRKFLINDVTKSFA